MIKMGWVLTMIVMEIILFWIALYCLWQYELRRGIRTNYKEYILIGIVFTVLETMLFSYLGYGGRTCCHSLVFLYLMIAAYIDYKQKIVYRVGSISLIAMTVYLFVSSFLPDATSVTEEIPVILLFCSMTVAMGAFSLIGWGDTLTYIGLFFWLASWDSEWMLIEVMAVYMLISNVVFFVFNIRNVDWKSLKLKEEAPFLPSMVVGVVLIRILMCLFYR